KIRCRTVGTDANAVERFIRRHNDSRNVYYQLNVVRADLGARRASKRDIVACVGLHCEIDPPEGVESLEAWQRDRRAHMTAWEHPTIPRPTLVVFSGSGFQLIWLLDEPTDLVEAVESRNRALVRLLDGDRNTWAVDRLLRLPGTLNHPGKRKRRKYGRTGAVP